MDLFLFFRFNETFGLGAVINVKKERTKNTRKIKDSSDLFHIKNGNTNQIINKFFFLKKILNKLLWTMTVDILTTLI